MQSACNTACLPDPACVRQRAPTCTGAPKHVWLAAWPQARGWATGVCAGVEEDGFSSNSGATLFGIDLTLTGE